MIFGILIPRTTGYNNKSVTYKIMYATIFNYFRVHSFLVPNTHKIVSSVFSQGGRGHWPVYYTSPQVFTITFFIRRLNNFGNLINFDWLVFDIECAKVPTTN